MSPQTTSLIAEWGIFTPTRDDIVVLSRQCAKFEAALLDVFALIDEGYLVRDTSRDHEPGWAIGQLEAVRRIAAAYAVATGQANPQDNATAKSSRVPLSDRFGGCEGREI